MNYEIKELTKAGGDSETNTEFFFFYKSFKKRLSRAWSILRGQLREGHLVYAGKWINPENNIYDWMIEMRKKFREVNTGRADVMP